MLGAPKRDDGASEQTNKQTSNNEQIKLAGSVVVW
jgi:hypothetical protein